MKFFEICAEVLVPKFTRAEVRLPGLSSSTIHLPWIALTLEAMLNNVAFIWIVEQVHTVE